MTGNELITITIEDGDKRISTGYRVLDADRSNVTKGEYHLLALDNLIKKFDSDTTKKDSEEVDECLDFDNCEQCGENAWDGRICHSCGLKHI